MSWPHWTAIDVLTSGTWITLVSVPFWSISETEWHLHLQIVAVLLGCLLAILQIAKLVTEWRKKKTP
jgi:membrane protein DedA with SNARE-associated domain